MADYIDAPYILLEKHYRTWDPHLSHWGRFDTTPYACVYGPHNDLLSHMYKHFNDSLIMHLLDVHLYDVVMYFHDLYFVLMMFGRVCSEDFSSLQEQEWLPCAYRAQG